LHHKQTLTNQIYLKEQVSNYPFTKYQQQQMKIVKVALIQRHNKSTNKYFKQNRMKGERHIQAQPTEPLVYYPKCSVL
jgi:hypothetical protein